MLHNVLFSTECCLYHNCIFLHSNNMFFINHALKFKDQLHLAKGWTLTSTDLYCTCSPDHSPLREANSHTFNTFLYFYGNWTFITALARSYPEPDKSHPHLHILWINCNITLPYTLRSNKQLLFPGSSNKFTKKMLRHRNCNMSWYFNRRMPTTSYYSQLGITTDGHRCTFKINLTPCSICKHVCFHILSITFLHFHISI